MSKKRIWTTAAVCAVAVVALAAALRVGGQTTRQEIDPANSLIPIETVSPQRADLANQMDFIGSLSAGDSVAVLPKLTAKVTDLRVKAGDQVKAGDVLFVMDTSDLQSQVDLAQLALDSAQTSYELTTLYSLDAQENGAYLQYDQARDAYEAADEAYDELIKDKKAKIEGMEAAIAAAKMILDDYLAAEWNGMSAEQALASAQKTLGEAETAWVANGASNDPQDTYYAAKTAAEQALADLEAVKIPYDNAVAGLSAYKQAISQASAGRDAAKTGYNAAKIAHDAVSGDARALQEELAGAQMQQAQINYNALMDQLGYATVTAPVDGTILSVSVQENNYATPSSVAVMMGSGQSMKVTFGLPANYFGQVQVGDTAVVEATGGSVSAVVTEVAPMLNPQTGTFSVTAEFANTANFLTGATAKVTLTTQHAEGVLTVPVDCVRYENNQPYVYLEQNGFAKKTYLTLGMTDEAVYEVVDGLTAQDKVISTWHPNLADGAAVSAQ